MGTFLTHLLPFPWMSVLTPKSQMRQGTLSLPRCTRAVLRSRVLAPRMKHILVAMDGGIYNVRNATCGGICLTCHGFTYSQLTPPAFNVPAGDTQQLKLLVNYDTGAQVDDTDSAAWTSYSTSVATVSKGLVTGVSAGTADITGQDTGTTLST
jgi:hypothetical protein